MTPRLAGACLVAAALTAGAPGTAHAAPPQQYYQTGDTGICGFWAASDTTPGGQLGGENVWNGVVWIRYTTTGSATVTCELKINGATQGIVLGAMGAGGVAAVDQIQYSAAVTDVVTICHHVQGGSSSCSDASTTSVVPSPVYDLLSQGDERTCVVLTTIAPFVNDLGVPGIIRIDMFTGDTYLLDMLVVDCPPYVA